MTDGAKKILIVDDEPDLGTYLAVLLGDQGYRTYQARSGEEALKAAAMFLPDLICLDIMMPRQSGIALYQKLKKDPRFRNVPAVFISAFSTARDFTGPGFRKLIPDAGVPEPEAYIEKPVDAARLLEVIAGIIG
ncbi:MAG TPA: response regulator [bacterium]|nr:response regulator [bacterium]